VVGVLAGVVALGGPDVVELLLEAADGVLEVDDGGSPLPPQAVTDTAIASAAAYRKGRAVSSFVTPRSLDSAI